MGINIRRSYSHQESHDVLMGKLNETQEVEGNPFLLQIANHLIAINVKPDEHHWWSPEMSLRLEEEGEGTTIYETIGPNPSVFTLAMFFVILGSVIFLAALMWVLSQMTVGDSSSLAWTITFLSGLMILATFGWLALGRMKAADQVSRLRKFVGDIIER